MGHQRIADVIELYFRAKKQGSLTELYQSRIEPRSVSQPRGQLLRSVYLPYLHGSRRAVLRKVSVSLYFLTSGSRRTLR